MISWRLPSWRSQRRNNHALPYNYDPYRRQLRNLPREMMPGVLEAFENLDALGKELNVKLHYFTWCGPDHVAFVLLEANDLSAISWYVFSIPMPAKINIVPVEHLHDTIAMARAATASAQD